jgi:hypothetical protein
MIERFSAFIWSIEPTAFTGQEVLYIPDQRKAGLWNGNRPGWKNLKHLIGRPPLNSSARQRFLAWTAAVFIIYNPHHE